MDTKLESLLPRTYTTVSKAMQKMPKILNIIGVVCHATSPKRISANNWSSTMVLTDFSMGSTSEGIPCTLFHVEPFPVNRGIVVILRDVRTQYFNKVKIQGPRDEFSYYLWDPVDADMQFKSGDFEQPDRAEQEYMKELHKWYKDPSEDSYNSSDFVYGQSAALKLTRSDSESNLVSSPSSPKSQDKKSLTPVSTRNMREKTLLNKIKPNTFFDCYAQIKYRNDIRPGVSILYVTDYTRHEHLQPSQDYDDSDIESQYKVRVLLYDEHTEPNVQVDDYVLLENVHAKLDKDGFLKCQIHSGDFDSATGANKINVSKIRNFSDDKLATLLERQKKYEKKRKTDDDKDNDENESTNVSSPPWPQVTIETKSPTVCKRAWELKPINEAKENQPIRIPCRIRGRVIDIMPTEIKKMKRRECIRCLREIWFSEDYCTECTDVSGEYMKVYWWFSFLFQSTNKGVPDIDDETSDGVNEEEERFAINIRGYKAIEFLNGLEPYEGDSPEEEEEVLKDLAKRLQPILATIPRRNLKNLKFNLDNYSKKRKYDKIEDQDNENLVQNDNIKWLPECDFVVRPYMENSNRRLDVVDTKLNLV